MLLIAQGRLFLRGQVENNAKQTCSEYRNKERHKNSVDKADSYLLLHERVGFALIFPHARQSKYNFWTVLVSSFRNNSLFDSLARQHRP